MDETWALGADIGGTKVKVGRIDSRGLIRDIRTIPTNVKGGPKNVEMDIFSAVKDIRKGVRTPPVGMGIGMAGQIDKETGNVLFSPNLDWHDVPLRSDLENILQMSVAVTNDVRAITWGEWLHGAGMGFDDVICLYVGTGVGGGLVIGGQIISGCTNTAGELGHLTVAIDGPPCTCGNNGCLEAIAGGWAIARRARQLISQNPEAGKMLLSHAEGQIESVAAETVAKAAGEGDKLSIEIVDEVSLALIAGCISLVNALNPCRLILGGGVIEGIPDLIRKVSEGVRQRALPTATRSLEIVPSLLGGDAGVVGAASLAMKTFR
jgi:glucokinase